MQIVEAVRDEYRKTCTNARSISPGLILSATIALAAAHLSDHYGGPAMLFALLLGIAFNYLSDSPAAGPGIHFSSRSILRIGIALLGARITWGEVQNLGLGTVALVITGMVVTIMLGNVFARALKLPRSFAILSAGAVAICGASAALAISSVLAKDEDTERYTILTVIGITTLSTVAMMVYPLLAAILEFNDRSAGIFIGATIHDVAQVVGAGFTVSVEAGETSTIVKLIRVAFLLPVVVTIGLMTRRTGQATARHIPLLPFFLVAFIILLAANSFQLINDDLVALMSEISRWCLLCAVSALGIRTSIGSLAKVGPRPLIAMVVQTFILALFVISALMFL